MYYLLAPVGVKHFHLIFISTLPIVFTLWSVLIFYHLPLLFIFACCL